MLDIIRSGLPDAHQLVYPFTPMSLHLAETSAHSTIVVLAIEKDSGVIIKQRHAFLRRKYGIDERRVVMSEISKHEMLCVVFAVRGHNTTIELKYDVLIVASGLASYVQGFSETKQCAEADRGCEARDWRVRF